METFYMILVYIALGLWIIGLITFNIGDFVDLNKLKNGLENDRFERKSRTKQSKKSSK